jgi:hypothetical protein
MKKFAAIGIAALTLLTACGGGGGSSTTPATTGTTGVGSIADTTSQSYTASLKAFAETWIAGNTLLPSLTDLVRGAGSSGQCSSSGSSSSTATATTFTNCVRSYPSNNAYNGSFTFTGSQSGSSAVINVATITSMNILVPSNLPVVQFSIPSGSFAGGDTQTGTTNVVSLTSGTATFRVGTSATSDTYIASNLNYQLTNNGSSLTAANYQSSGTRAYTITKGSTNYDVNIGIGGISATGNNNPNSGNSTISYTTTTGCSPMRINFLSTTQFSLTCTSGNDTITKNWTDADVVAAINAAKL